MALVKHIFDDVIPVVKPFLLETIAQAKPIVMEIVKALGEFGKAVFEYIGKKIQEAKVIWDAVWPVLRPIVENELDKIKVVILTVLEVIKGIIKTATSIIKGDWSGAWENIKKIFSDIWEGIKKVANKQIEFMKGVGKDIIDGLINGIKSMAGKAADAMGKIVSSLPATVKKLLGISSPSKVFAGIGENMMLGLTEGLNNLYPNVSAKLNKITTGLSTNFNVNALNNPNPNTIFMSDLNSKKEQVIINAPITIDVSKIQDINDIINLFKSIKQEAIARGGV
jgi:phage-related protein